MSGGFSGTNRMMLEAPATKTSAVIGNTAANCSVTFPQLESFETVTVP
jgi:hypothetical protein